jgi:hypothetical protein
MMISASAPGRAAHVFVHYLPMIVLGLIFLILGLSPAAPHIGYLPLGNLFVLLGAILLVGAILGMAFTRCPTCFVRWRVMCFHEPDVFWDNQVEDYYRDLVPENGHPRW